MACFSIRLEKPLRTKEIRPRRPRMRNPQTDAPFTVVIEVVLVEQIDDVEAQQHLLIVPGQRDHVRERRIVNSMGSRVRRIRFRIVVNRRSQARSVQHLAGDVGPFQEPICHDGRTRHELRVIAKDPAR